MESVSIKKTHRAEPQHTCGPTGAEKGPVYTYICILETEISRQPASCLLSGCQTVSGVSGWMEIISKTLLKHSSGWRSFIKNNKKNSFQNNTSVDTGSSPRHLSVQTAEHLFQNILVQSPSSECLWGRCY